MEKQMGRSYCVEFQNGIPTLSEESYNSLIIKGITDWQISNSLEILSRKMVEKCNRLGVMLDA